jgi:hypothetical protein
MSKVKISLFLDLVHFFNFGSILSCADCQKCIIMLAQRDFKILKS